MVIRYGVVTNSIYGSVILKNVTKALAPSTLAASYNSSGIFWRIPVTCSMVYGIPTHKLITITVTRAQVALVKKGRGFVISPRFISSVFTAPEGWSIVRMISKDTNIGTAMERIKQNLQKLLNRVPFRLIMIARIIPII